MAARSGLIVPANEAELLITRQMTTFIYYNHLIEEILEGSESRATKTSGKEAEKETARAMAKLTIDPKPLKASVFEVIAQAVEQKVASEDYLGLLRSEPSYSIRQRFDVRCRCVRVWPGKASNASRQATHRGLPSSVSRPISRCQIPNCITFFAFATPIQAIRTPRNGFKSFMITKIGTQTISGDSPKTRSWRSAIWQESSVSCIPYLRL